MMAEPMQASVSNDNSGEGKLYRKYCWDGSQIKGTDTDLKPEEEEWHPKVTVRVRFH